MSILALVGLSPEPILCFYVNTTAETQIAHLANTDFHVNDRIIRPDGHMLFEAPASAVLEIYALTANRNTLLRTITCKELKISHELIERMLRWLS